MFLLYNEFIRSVYTRVGGKLELLVKTLQFFGACTGESWDYMGSRRFLWQMQQGAADISGLSLDDIEKVIEVDMVGNALRPATGETQLYLHSQQGGAYGDTNTLTNVSLCSRRCCIQQLRCFCSAFQA